MQRKESNAQRQSTDVVRPPLETEKQTARTSQTKPRPFRALWPQTEVGLCRSKDGKREKKEKKRRENGSVLVIRLELET